MSATKAAFSAGSSFKITSRSGLNGALFVSPPPAGRRITAGFSYIQRLGKSASVDVWFPEALRDKVNAVLLQGVKPTAADFPAQWAAVRQFDLLQEAGNHKIYDLDPTYLMRTLSDLTRNMRGGGYRVTVATLGSYVGPECHDELEILDRRLQNRIANCINMLYLEQPSRRTNASMGEALRREIWDYRMALPHIGVTLGARDLFKPTHATRTAVNKNSHHTVPGAPHKIQMAADWVEDLGVREADSDKRYLKVMGNPQAFQYAVKSGCYEFSPSAAWKDVFISYRYSDGSHAASSSEQRHRKAQAFFEILGLLPHKHIVHDTAIGLQLPEALSDQQWIYVAPEGERVGDFVHLMDDLFAPFNKLSLSMLHGRADATSEVKASVTHMQGYGDRLRATDQSFYQGLARHVLR